LKPVSYIMSIKTTEEWLIEINYQTNVKIEQKAQSQLNYMRKLHINILGKISNQL
jgi:type IV secretory pathway component VirB8